MGFSLTGTRIMYFITTVIITGIVSSILNDKTIYIASSKISYGYHILRLIRPQALNEEFVLTI